MVIDLAYEKDFLQAQKITTLKLKFCLLKVTNNIFLDYCVNGM